MTNRRHTTSLQRSPGGLRPSMRKVAVSSLLQKARLGVKKAGTEECKLRLINVVTPGNLQFSFCNFHFAIPSLIYFYIFYYILIYSSIFYIFFSAYVVPRSPGRQAELFLFGFNNSIRKTSTLLYFSLFYYILLNFLAPWRPLSRAGPPLPRRDLNAGHHFDLISVQ